MLTTRTNNGLRVDGLLPFFHIGLICVLFFFSPEFAVTQDSGPYFANGIKIGEVTQDSAIVWARLTQHKSADFSRLAIFTEGLPGRETSKLEMPPDIVPGQAGQVRLRYWRENDPASVKELPTVRVHEDDNYTHQFQLCNLKAGIRYRLRVDSFQVGSDAVENSLEGAFRTAYPPDQSAPVKFIVSTCQAIRSVDSGADGHRAYKQMKAANPDFFVHTGDILYYDKVPLCQSISQARSKWNLMFSYRNNLEFFRVTSSYFMKDDHDTLKNDCWPGQQYGQLTFADGLKIFREQVPMGEKTYRTVRWGNDVQIWMTENRDFRSSNRQPDGPEKTILGDEQKQWLFKTVEESNATHKFIICPGPIVGPDKKGKSDNHSNAAFQTEGQELRGFLSKRENTYVICGDRHWQYCSQDPRTGLIEFGCGPINDQHNFGGNPGVNPTFHRYFGSRGGFLLVAINGFAGKVEWMSSNQFGDGGNPTVAHTEFLPIKD